MTRDRQKQLAETFRQAHRPPPLLLLPNAWDAMSARQFEAAGFGAVATTSGGVAWSLGFPDGEWQRFDVGAGEIAILPQGWFHYIENVGEDVLQMLVIFNNSAPNDIGISVGFQTVPKEVLGLTFGVPAETFDKLDLDVEYIAPQ